MRLPRLIRRAGGRSLGREIAVALAIKLLVLYGLWSVFFSRPAIHDMTAGMAPERVAAALLAPPAAPSENRRTARGEPQ